MYLNHYSGSGADFIRKIPMDGMWQSIAEGKKRKRHKRMNLWMIHSHPPTLREKGGVHFQHLSPTQISRMEILQFKGITAEDRKRILEYAHEKIESDFGRLIVSKAILTLAFGIPNFLHDQKTYSCQHLVISAYSSAGIHFKHPFQSFPFYNIGRYLGHPLGHPKDRVNPKYPYLIGNHHISGVPRFELKAAVLRDKKPVNFIWKPKISRNIRGIQL